jgi:proline iminopeptidase
MRVMISVLMLLLFSSCASMGTATGTITSTDGVSLWYRTVGQGSPIVVIHGGPGMDHASLAADLEPLAGRHRLIFYDQRGGGRSTLPSDPSLLSIGHHVADLDALRRHFNLNRMTLLAHSFGPAIAALYAIEHPHRVERMIFLGPIPPLKGTFTEDYGKEMAARLSAAEMQRLEELNAQFGTSADPVAVCREYWKIATPPRVAKALPVSLVKSDLCTASGEAISYGMTKTNPVTFGSLGEWDWRPRLAKLETPTLVIHGEEEAIPMALVREWSVVMPDARLLRLEGTGHFPHAERPDTVFAAIEEFLAGRWPTRAVKEARLE